MRVMKAESVQLNDIEMYYETEGVGEPLLLLHGGTGCQEHWIHAGRDDFVREYKLIKPDARGHGRFDQPSQDDYTPAVCAGHPRVAGSSWHQEMSGDRIEHGGKYPSPHGDAATGST
jgi:pimeloyl-ACP methyl ester carboxylesterase